MNSQEKKDNLDNNIKSEKFIENEASPIEPLLDNKKAVCKIKYFGKTNIGTGLFIRIMIVIFF